MTLPLLISVPHGGLQVPPEVRDNCLLTHEDILEDGDKGAPEIYGPLRAHVAAFVSTDVPRAIVDMNRRADDIRADGVVKTETIFKVPIYREPLDDALIATLIDRYHRPYHERLSALAKRDDIIFGVDCHTMAGVAPPIEANAGEERPPVCLGDADGSLPEEWRDSLIRCFEDAFAPHRVTLNDPFRGGYITRTHSKELPWIQLELSRAPFMDNDKKTACVLQALRCWCDLRKLSS